MIRLATAIVRATAWLVPAESRSEWRREWSAEIHARRGDIGTVVFALGSLAHAAWLQKEQWRPDMVMADLRYGWRQLKGRPAMAIAAIVTLAIGIGATTAIFSVVYGVLLKPLPYRDPARLVQLWETNPNFNWTEATIAPGNLISWRERNHSFEDMAWYFGSDSRSSGTQTLSMEGQSEPSRVLALGVSTNFFDLLGTKPQLGRTFLPGEDVAGRQRVVILSQAFWRSSFGGDPSIVNKPVVFNGRTYSIIGVMPENFRFDNSPADCWTPLVMDIAQSREVRRPHYLRAVARLKPGATIASARADLTAIAADLERAYPVTNTKMSVGLGPLSDWFVGESRVPLLAFFGAVAFVLVIACVNVANLFLSRIGERRREMSLRAALGANRLRLLRQLLAEAGIVAIAGACAGVALAAGALELFLRYAPAGLPRLDDVGLNGPVVAFAAGVTVLTTLTVGLAPAWRASRADIKSGLGDGGRTIAARSGMSRLLVGAEVALAVVLLVGAALTLRSFVSLVSIRPSFPVQGLVSGRVSLPGARYSEVYKAAHFFENVSAQLRNTPGVVGAGSVSRLPLEGAAYTSQFYIEGRPEFHGYEVRHNNVTLGYLRALGAPIVAGRDIDAADLTSTMQPIVVNETFARTNFPAGNAVGSRIDFDAPSAKSTWCTIVGVVADMPQDGLGIPTQPEIFQAELQQDDNVMSVLVRSTLPPDVAIAALRRAIREADPQVAIFDVRSMTDGIGRSVARERLAMSLASAFAASALLLAAVGIFSVAAQSVASRTREIGVRVAFGATRADLVGMILRQELGVVAAGLAIGAVAAFLLARLVTSLLFHVSPADGWSFAASVLLLSLTALLACLIPARRALRLSPVDALRGD
jgi:predicted permease